MSSVTGSEVAINAFIDQIRPIFDYILVVTACSTCLFTLFLNVLAICVALTLGVLTDLNSVKAIFDPFSQVSKSVYITTSAFTLYPLLLYHSILLTRLFSLYPVASTPSFTLVKVFAFAFCSNALELQSLWVSSMLLSKSQITSMTLVQNQGALWYRNPKMTAEWTMQMADNLYSVSFFLYNLHVRTSSIRSVGGLSERIWQIFYVSVANLVFPLLFNIAQIILITTDRSAYIGTLLFLINHFVTVIGVLCAAVWFSTSEWVRGRKEALVDAADFARWGGDKFQAANDIGGV
ncbi:hypothetical protein EDC04DRAFT_2895815 [Pisolithus marmoratus]|nr:hypothetical protein EDC04DRAFT_2895815 [Pisolithus marmoratus]